LCGHCGVKFRRQPGGDRVFCSFGCYRRFRGETRPETHVRRALTDLGVAFEIEVKVGRLSIDCVLVEHGIAFEVDGAYWHQDVAKEARRDARIRAAGLVPVHLLVGKEWCTSRYEDAFRTAVADALRHRIADL
jgi:hypothetical protein